MSPWQQRGRSAKECRRPGYTQYAAFQQAQLRQTQPVFSEATRHQDIEHDTRPTCSRRRQSCAQPATNSCVNTQTEIRPKIPLCRGAVWYGQNTHPVEGGAWEAQWHAQQHVVDGSVAEACATRSLKTYVCMLLYKKCVRLHHHCRVKHRLGRRAHRPT